MSGALSFDEIAARLKTAAQVEIAGINQIECFVSRFDSPQLRELTVIEARRQAQALGVAHRIALALAKRPDLALGLTLGLGLSAADLEEFS